MSSADYLFHTGGDTEVVIDSILRKSPTPSSVFQLMAARLQAGTAIARQGDTFGMWFAAVVVDVVVDVGVVVVVCSCCCCCCCCCCC